MIPAIDRYDGPLFRVLRKYSQGNDVIPKTYVLSARLGLIAGDTLIPKYDQRLTFNGNAMLLPQIEDQLNQILGSCQPDNVFVSVGTDYWRLLESPLQRNLVSEKLVVATGGIGGRASQLSYWLRAAPPERFEQKSTGCATLLGTTLRLTPAEVLQKAQQAFDIDPTGARNFETWYVPIGQERRAPKWLVGILFGKPVSRFRTSDARRVLSLLGIHCAYDIQARTARAENS